MADKPQTQTPAFVFVDNASERMIFLRRVVSNSPKEGIPPKRESTMVGRGLNYVRADYVAANPDMDTFGLRIVDPTRYAESEVAEALRRGTSKQAFAEWGKLEKRATVITKIKARLNGAQAQAAEADAEA